MSWEVEGRYYHDYSEYQRAVARASERRAAAEARSLQQQFDRQQRQIRETENELRAANNNYQQQMELNARLGRQVSEMQRTQHRLQEAQANIEREMNAGFAEVRQHFAQTDEEIAQLERDHEAHKAQVRQQFSAVNDAMQRGLSEAEKRRKETEERLQAAISAVDQKFEADRRQRMQEAANDLSRAAGLSQMVRDLLAPCTAQAEILDLQAEAHGIQEQLETARRQQEQKNAAGALAAAEAAYAGVRKLVFQRAEREARLADARRRISDVVTDCRQDLESEGVKACFAAERAAALEALSALEKRSQTRYTRYDRLPVRAEEDERLMSRMEEEVRSMNTATSEIQVLFNEREERIGEILTAMTKVCGELTAEPQRRFAKPSDPKSLCVVQCHFETGKIDLHVPLDMNAKFTLEAHGHDTNRSCDLQFQRVMGQLQGNTLVSRSEQDRTVRTEPRLNIPDQAQSATWQGIDRRLERLREDAQ